MEEYITIKSDIQTEIVEKKSRFLINVYKIETKEQAEEYIKKIKKEHFSANHSCSAYRIKLNDSLLEKMSDDGEPTGTAGIPMLNILQKNELLNVLVVVTRYFGGIMFGAGGLVRIYSESAKVGISKTEKVIKKPGQNIEILLEYKEFETFKYFCRKNNIEIINTIYEDNIKCSIDVDVDNKEKLINLISEKELNIIEYEVKSEKYIDKSI